jgi:hypothetical protein
MRIRTLWLAPALLAMLGLFGVALADPGDQKGGPGAKGKTGAKAKRGEVFQPGPGGRGRGGPGGRGGPRDGFGPGPGDGVQRALDSLNLSGTKKEKAEAVVKAYQDDVRKLTDLAHSDLLLKMQDVLSEQEFKRFKEVADRRPGPGPGGPGGRGGRGLTEDQIVERILTFDKNKDGKITKDELPERMQDLIAKGDTNKDGALDKDEIKKLAADLAREGGFRGFDGRGGPGGRGRGGPGGFAGRGGPSGPGGPAGGLTRAVDDLNLSGTKKEKAETAVKAYEENVRKVTDLARSDLLVKMKDLLSEQELKQFKDGLDRPFGPGGRGGPAGRPAPTGGGSRVEELEKKIDQLQKQLEDLKREIRR